MSASSSGTALTAAEIAAVVEEDEVRVPGGGAGVYPGVGWEWRHPKNNGEKEALRM